MQSGSNDNVLSLVAAGGDVVGIRAKMTSQNWRSDLVQIWMVRESKTTGITCYSDNFESEASPNNGGMTPLFSCANAPDQGVPTAISGECR